MQARLDLIGIVVEDMARSLAFYRRLGLDIPPDSDDQPHVETTLAGGLRLAWDAVGVHNGCKQGTPPPPPCVGSANATLPIQSPHPYGNNGDCTWTYSNGTAGFRFHFSLMDMEQDYDYVYV